MISTAQAIAWTAAKPEGRLPEAFTGIAVDSRAVSPGNLFVALKGERFDGHAFLTAAAAAGAAAAVVARASPLLGHTTGLPQLAVDDTLRALGQLARGYRQTFDLRAAVAVTGSAGKTSTKELIAAALSPLGPVLKTEGNFNNEIGLPLTLFKLRPEHRALAVELGMNHAGEIARLAAMALPGIGLVLNVREAHLEQLGSLAAIAEAKGELFFGLPSDGVSVANADDALVLAQARRAGRRLLTFGEGEADVRLLSVDDRGLRGVEFQCSVRGQAIGGRLALLGAVNAGNACAALATALAAGVDPRAALEAMRQARAAPHRLASIELPQGVTLLDDCYNANPASMGAALETLRHGAPGRRLGAILGDMLELGPTEVALHREVGHRLSGFAWVLCHGARAPALAEGAREVGVGAVGVVDDVAAGLRFVQAQLRPGDAVLLKASRGMRLERYALALGAPAEGGH